MGRKIDWRPVAFAIVALGLRIGSSATADLAYLLVAAYALTGRAQAIQALAMSWLLTNISPGIAPPASMAGLFRFIILFCAALSISINGGWLPRQRRARKFLFMTLAFGFFIICHSLVFSYYPDVSILKGISWTIAMATVIAAWMGLTETERWRVSQQIFGGLIALLTVSLPTVTLPVGYLKNETGFQGVLNHPQVFGPVMALLGAWSIGKILGSRKPSWWLFMVAGACLVMILLSQARTAGLALVLGVGGSMALSPFLANKRFAFMAPGLRSLRLWSIGWLALLGGVAMAPQISQEIHHYITKAGRAEVGGVVEAYEDSRGALIEHMLQNISQYPVTGIGFGIGSDPEAMEIGRDPLFGMPISASVEKGVTPLAVLEELGIPGAIFAAAWIVMFLRGSAASGLAPFAVCMTALFLNLGEATLFSPGGTGLLTLILFGWAFSSGQTNPRQIKPRKPRRNDKHPRRKRTGY